MSIIFVHGVNTRQGPAYNAFKEVTCRFLTRHLADAAIGGKTLGQTPRIEFAYWGDLGATLAWNGRSVPCDAFEELAAASGFDLTLLLEQLLAEATPDGPKFNPLTGLAQKRLSLAVDVLNDLVLQNTPGGREAEVAAFVVRASTYASANEAPSWLAGISRDEEFIAKLQAEVTRVPGIEVQGFADVIDLVSFAGRQLKQAFTGVTRTFVDRAGDFASKKLLASTRAPLNAVLGRFFGDAAIYFSSRGDRANPGEIPRRLLDILDKARSRSVGEPLVIIGHSLGGVIAFDLLSHFRPGLVVDLFISVGSQVAHFEELKLYRSSEKSVNPPNRAKTPANIKRWINVYDQVDIFAYAAKPIFDRVDVDAEYDTRTHVIRSHTAYFQQEQFYMRLCERMRTLP